jgi:PTH1 family peptidyl-tRNA hydrolase
VIEYLVAGLGNPGNQYDNTRHNAGFWVVDELARRAGLKKVKKLKFHSTCALTGNLLLLKPQTFMNRSGQAVRAAAEFYKLPPERIIIVYDDTALPPGKLRLRASGSDGGHNGMKDILYHLQTDQFPRVRLGVGAPHSECPGEDTATHGHSAGSHKIDLADWVLAQLSSAERKSFDEAAARAADAVECVIAKGIEAAMNNFNQKEV